jgi:tetratricopeptide (TPR) repeat protein
MDPAGQPVVPFKSLTPDTFNSTVMSIFGTTDTTPQAGYGAPSPDSINGGAGPGGFISPPAGSTGGSTAGISTGGAAIRGFTGFSNSAADLGAAAGDSAANAAAAAAATFNKIAPGSGAGTLNGSLGAGRGSGSDLFGNETNLNAGDSTTDSNVPSGARSSSTGENAGESTDNGAAIGNTPGAAEALKQAQDLARQEGKLPAESPGKDEDQQEQQRPHPREAAKSAGFFSVLPDSPAKVALVEIRQGRYDQALNHLNQLWALNPHALELQYLMGVACVMSQRPREAEEHYQRVLQSPLASGELKQLAYTGLKRLHSN